MVNDDRYFMLNTNGTPNNLIDRFLSLVVMKWLLVLIDKNAAIFFDFYTVEKDLASYHILAGVLCTGYPAPVHLYKICRKWGLPGRPIVDERRNRAGHDSS